MRWYGIKYGYEKGTDIVQDIAGNKLQKQTDGILFFGRKENGNDRQHSQTVTPAADIMAVLTGCIVLKFLSADSADLSFRFCFISYGLPA